MKGRLQGRSLQLMKHMCRGDSEVLQHSCSRAAHDWLYMLQTQATYMSIRKLQFVALLNAVVGRVGIHAVLCTPLLACYCS